MVISLEEMGKKAKQSAFELAQMPTSLKNAVLNKMADALIEKEEEILTQNRLDLEKASEMPQNFTDRLTLDHDRILGMAEGLRQVASLPDPIGNEDAAWVNHAGLQIAKRRVPLGVVGMIYEARPNVTVDAAGLCFKSGNAVILRGGKEALRTNVKLCEILRSVVASSGLDENAVQIIQETSHEIANQFMQLTDYLDVLIPRGSARLIKAVVNNAKVPVIETGAGNCHLYVDKDAEFDMAEKIVVNAKCQRPSVCNAAEKLLIHEDVAGKFLPRVAQALEERNVELRGDERTCAILGSRCRPATVEDWDTEYNDYILTIGIVDSLDEAILHINQHSTHHSESIITENYRASQRFLNEIDSACVYVNASTRFTDGFEFGFGAEIGIATQKLHARGPMGLNELTTIKYVIRGDGQIRE